MDRVGTPVHHEVTTWCTTVVRMHGIAGILEACARHGTVLHDATGRQGAGDTFELWGAADAEDDGYAACAHVVRLRTPSSQECVVKIQGRWDVTLARYGRRKDKPDEANDAHRGRRTPYFVEPGIQHVLASSDPFLSRTSGYHQATSVPRIFFVYDDGVTHITVQEFLATGHTLYHELFHAGASTQDVSVMAWRVLTSLHGLHKRGYIHGDAHLGNVWVTPSDVHLIDLGRAVPISRKEHTMATAWYKTSARLRMWDFGYVVGSMVGYIVSYMSERDAAVDGSALYTLPLFQCLLSYLRMFLQQVASYVRPDLAGQPAAAVAYNAYVTHCFNAVATSACLWFTHGAMNILPDTYYTFVPLPRGHAPLPAPHMDGIVKECLKDVIYWDKGMSTETRNRLNTLVAHAFHCERNVCIPKHVPADWCTRFTTEYYELRSRISPTSHPTLQRITKDHDEHGAWRAIVDAVLANV